MRLDLASSHNNSGSMLVHNSLSNQIGMLIQVEEEGEVVEVIV